MKQDIWLFYPNDGAICRGTPRPHTETLILFFALGANKQSLVILGLVDSHGALPKKPHKFFSKNSFIGSPRGSVPSWGPNSYFPLSFASAISTMLLLMIELRGHVSNNETLQQHDGDSNGHTFNIFKYKHWKQFLAIIFGNEYGLL